jgi:signal transduction histidine kinase
MSNKPQFRIMLVEDDPNFADWASLAFKKSGIDNIIEIMPRGEEAIKILKADQNRYDVLIVDYKLPGLDGIEFIRILKEEGIDLPIVMLTGQGSEQIAVEALKLGAVDYLVKDPSTFRVLPAVVEKAYRQKQLEKLNRELQQKILQQNRELAETNKKLMIYSKELIKSEKMASLLFFVRGISHEINNPLAGIVGFSELLLHKVEPADPIRDDLEEIRRCAYRVKETVSKLAKFCGKEKQKTKPVNIHEILNEVLDYFQLQAENAGIEVIKDFCEKEPVVEGVAVDLQQAFMAIMVNAQKAMQKGGKLTLTTKIPNGNVEITFEDTGKGIKEEDLEKVFSPFFTTDRSGESSGLGLAVTYGTVKESKGEMKVRSKQGEGSAFTIILPLYQKI